MLRCLTSFIIKTNMTRILTANFASKTVNGTTKQVSPNKDKQTKVKPGKEKHGKEKEGKHAKGKNNAVDKKKKPNSNENSNKTNSLDKKIQILEKFVEYQQKLKDDLDYSQPTQSGMDFNEWLRRRDEKEVTFTPPVRYSQTGETMGLRMRTEYEKLR